MKTELLHADVADKIIGTACEVYRELGYGIFESVYQRAMQAELQRQGLKAEIEAPIKGLYKGVVVGGFRADLFANEVVITELKVAKEYNPEDEPQLLNGLKATGVKVEFQRRVF